MHRVAWATDLHLTHADPIKIIEFCNTLIRSEADAIILTGDISDAPDLQEHLTFLSSRINTPIYFVLGNHDFYHSSISYVRKFVHELSIDLPKLTWLSENGIIPLTTGVCLIGHDGWCDGRNGDYINSKALLNDYRVISDFLGLSKTGVLDVIQSLAAQSVAYLMRTLPLAIAKFKSIILATHVPPFEEACLYNGGRTGVDWLPHFSCKVVGDLLKNVMQANPQCHMTVLCGHTHHKAEVDILPNLKVKVGYASYGYPIINEIIELGSRTITV